MAVARWPARHISLPAVKQWIQAVTAAPVAARPEILRAKIWGVTARFVVAGSRVVFKASYTPLFPQAPAIEGVLAQAAREHVAPLLSSDVGDDHVWLLYENVGGDTVDHATTVDDLVLLAQTLGEVQVRVAELDLRALPLVRPRDVPTLLLDDGLADQPVELVRWLWEARERLEDWAIELEQFPLSLDHPDVNVSNGLLRPSGDMVILDWEEATVGCPFFSLDRLLGHAEEVDAVADVRAAYIDALPWRTRREREHAFDLARRLAPLKLAVEARAFARGLGWSDPHTAYTTQLIAAARKRAICSEPTFG